MTGVATAGRAAAVAAGGVLAVVLLMVTVLGGVSASQTEGDSIAAVAALESLAAQECTAPPPSTPASVLVAGDSITVGAEAALAAALAGTPVRFVARVGWRLADAAGPAEAAARASPPGLLVVALGANDWGSGATPAGRSAYAAAADRLVTSVGPAQDVLWVLPYARALSAPETDRAGGIAADLEALDSATAGALRGHSNVRVLNMDQAFGTDASLVGPDGLHPSAMGVRRWAAAVANAADGGITVPASGAVPAAVGGPPAGGADLDPVQTTNAQAIIAVANAAGLGAPGAVIGVMVALTESSLDSTAANGDHVGLFQQAPSWGSAAQRTDPTSAAALFFTRLKATRGWQQMAPWIAAQAVQQSQFADGSNYEAKLAEAQQIVGTGDQAAAAAGCGQQTGALPAVPGGKLPPGFTIPATATPAELRAVTFALSKVGGPYVWGGNGPSGYDCSGLVTAAWAFAGVTIPRTSEAELDAGSPVASLAAMAPGDLILIPGSGDGGTLASPGHVAMYIGTDPATGAPLDVAAADTQVGIIVQPVAQLISGGLSGIRHIG